MSEGSFQMNEAKCPECGAPLQIPANAEWLTCGYCGTSVHVTYHQQQTGIDPDGTVRDRATGYGLFHLRAPEGWQVTGTALQQTGSVSRPFMPQVQLRDRSGGVIDVRMGEAGTRNSAGMAALKGMYGSQLVGVETVNYAEPPDPLALTDAIANGLAASLGATELRFTRQLASPDLEARGQAAFARMQRMAQAEGGHVANPFIGIVLRIYECACNGQPWKVATFVEMAAAKDGMGVGEMGASMMEGFGGLVNSIGGLFGGGQTQGGTTSFPNPFGGQAQERQASTTTGDDPYASIGGFLMGGGLLGKMKRDREAAAQQSMQQPAQQAAPVQQPMQQPAQQAQQAQQPAPQSASWCTPDFTQYMSGGTVFWRIETIATFAAPADTFDAQLESAFLPLISSIEVHPDVESLSIQAAQQEAARIQGATQTQLSQNQAAFNAQQAAHRQQQAAFNAYNQSISDARNAHHQQFMASSQAQFDHHAPDFSEAIRGVNTYTTSDGREVELSVHADHAWENQAGDVIGTSGSFDPGASWTEIPRT